MPLSYSFTDGGGHVIRNLNGGVGLFKTMGAATVKNLGFVNASLTVPGGYGGLIAAVANGATFQQCFATGSFTLDTQSVSVPTICGLVGYTENGSFSRCYAATNTGVDAAIHLSVCAQTLDVAVTDCFYAGSGYGISDAGESVSDADVASGRLAYLLNGSVDYGTGPYYQKLGTDTYPIILGDYNYVYQTLDNTAYTNDCPHHLRDVHEGYLPTCTGEGWRAYFHCNNPVCNLYYYADSTRISNEKEAMLSLKPVVVAHKPSNGKGEWKYSATLTKDDAIYYDAMSFTTTQNAVTYSDYIVTYTVFDDEPVVNLHCFYSTTFQDGIPSLRFYVNGVERTALRITMTNDGQEHHYVATIDGLHKYDLIKVMMPAYSMPWSITVLTQVTVATEKPSPTISAHHFHEAPIAFDCVEGGYDAHIECSVCGNAFSSSDHAASNDDLVPLSTYWLEPTHDSHDYALSGQRNADGLHTYSCSHAHCQAYDPSRFIIPGCINDEDVPIDYADGLYTASEPLALQYGDSYTAPVPFTTPSLTYSVPVYAGSWSSWSVPFEVNTDQLGEAGFDAAYIEGIHRYDTDDDGTIDRTTLEVIRIKNGTLRAGTPYLIHPQSDETTLSLSIDDAALHTANDRHPINTATAMASYDFVPTYITVPSSEAAGSYYIIGSGNNLGPTTSTVPALDWYLKITDKGTPFDALQGAQTIAIRVVGEKDVLTSIYTPYAAELQTEEIYDLTGRRLPTPAQGKVNIINGKKRLVK